MTVIIVVPLTLSSVNISENSSLESTVSSVAGRWADAVGWQLLGVTTTGDTVTTSGDTVTVKVTGALPIPGTASLQSQLGNAGVDTSKVRVEFVPTYSVDLTKPGS
jgi:hypothetical protein